MKIRFLCIDKQIWRNRRLPIHIETNLEEITYVAYAVIITPTTTVRLHRIPRDL